MNVGLVYSSEIRDNGTPCYFRQAFKQAGLEFAWYQPAGELPRHDFYIYLDDGRDDLTWLPPHPCGYYVTDTHLGWEYRYRKASQFDLVWCAQMPAAKRMGARWLPLACEPMAHPTAEEVEARGGPAVPEKVYDVAFIGHLQSPAESARVDCLNHVFRTIPNFWFQYGIFHEDMAMAYHRARIGLNHAVRDDLNMRFFELASIGVPQLCSRSMIGARELGFIEDEHYIAYDTPEEAVEKIRLVLYAPRALNVMAQRAHALVRSRHTYLDRARTMIQDVSDLLQQPSEAM